MRVNVVVQEFDNPGVNFRPAIGLEVEVPEGKSEQSVVEGISSGIEGLIKGGIVPGVTHTSGQIASALGVDTPGEDTGTDPLKGDGEKLREREAKKKGK